MKTLILGIGVIGTTYGYVFKKAGINNYPELEKLLKTSGIETEIPYDMIEWIWIHMTINAGVVTC